MMMMMMRVNMKDIVTKLNLANACAMTFILNFNFCLKYENVSIVLLMI